jgi:hypothetical protein
MSSAAKQISFEVYAGRDRRGFVSLKASKFVAFDDDGRKLGSYVARRDAIDAINLMSRKVKGGLH